MADELDHRFWAKKALKFLVDRVRNYHGGPKFVYYGELAKAIGYPEPHQGSLFSARISRTLGELGFMLRDLIIDGQRPPYIQALVVNSKTKLPGNGIKEFFEDYPNLPRDKQKDLLAKVYSDIFEFGDRWLKVLQKLGVNEEDRSYSSSPIASIALHNPYGSEGSPEHRALRDHVFEHPELVDVAPVSKYREYPLKSGDLVDVVFKSESALVAVEVKSRRSGPDDLERGIFQCVKYKAVLEAEKRLKGDAKEVSSVLVIEGDLPKDLRADAQRLGVQVYERVTPAGSP